MKFHFHKYSKWSCPIRQNEIGLEQFRFCTICNKYQYRYFHTSRVFSGSFEAITKEPEK
jgi:hypothetical protein